MVNFILKIFFTAKKSLNTGQILPHIVAIKTVSIAVYPGHYEMMSFCKGFMMYDIPWANNFFGSAFGSSFDYIPAGYKLFYTNMNIGSMYFIPLILLIMLVIIDRVMKMRDKRNVSNKEKKKE